MKKNRKNAAVKKKLDQFTSDSHIRIGFGTSNAHTPWNTEQRRRIAKHQLIIQRSDADASWRRISSAKNSKRRWWRDARGLHSEWVEFPN